MKTAKRWVQITSIESIPLREGRAVQVGQHEIAIFNFGDRIFALENHCPHRAGPLADGIVSGGTVVCPLHAWKIDLATGSVTKPSENSQCVRTFPARVENGVVLLDISHANSVLESSQPNCLASITEESTLGRAI